MKVVSFVTVHTKHLYNTETEKKVLRKYCVAKRNNREAKFKRHLENISYQVALFIFHVMVVSLFSQRTCSCKQQVIVPFLIV